MLSLLNNWLVDNINTKHNASVANRIGVYAYGNTRLLQCRTCSNQAGRNVVERIVWLMEIIDNNER